MSRIFASLRTRILAAHLLVIILGAGTLIVLAELLAPSFFSDDLQRMNDMMTNPDVMSDMMADPNLMSDMMTESPPSGFITPSVEADLQEAFDLPRLDPGSLLRHGLSNDHARPGFARGLIARGEDLIIAGSSPATIAAYRPGSSRPITSVTITLDVRNAIHGLEMWPHPSVLDARRP